VCDVYIYIGGEWLGAMEDAQSHAGVVYENNFSVEEKSFSVQEINVSVPDKGRTQGAHGVARDAVPSVNPGVWSDWMVLGGVDGRVEVGEDGGGMRKGLD
jgi:hypothetical protein